MPVPETDPIVNIPVVTPFDSNDRVDHDALSRNIERWMKTPATGFLFGSQSGEEWYLSDDEKLAMVRTAADTIDDRRFIVGGIDCPGVMESLRRADAFADAGAEMLRIRFPRDEALIEPYFQQILSRSPLPVLLMHQCAPDRFGLAADPAAPPEVLGAVANMDNVFGYVTDHDIRFEARVRRHVGSDRRFWICNGSLILSGTMIGCNGTTTAFSNIWPAALHELLTLGMAGNFTHGQELQEKIRRIDEVMLPYRAAGIKASMNLLGFEARHPRAPTKPMPPEAILRLETVMRDTGLLPE